jgi:small membrane protein
MIIKIFVTIFVVFAISRAILRHRDGSVKSAALLIWITIWSGILFFVWWPKVSDYIAQSVGIGRGVDALVYISIVALFYGMFRIYVKLEFTQREITGLVRKLALKEKNKIKK